MIKEWLIPHSKEKNDGHIIWIDVDMYKWIMYKWLDMIYHVVLRLYESFIIHYWVNWVYRVYKMYHECIWNIGNYSVYTRSAYIWENLVKTWMILNWSLYIMYLDVHSITFLFLHIVRTLWSVICLTVSLFI